MSHRLQRTFSALAEKNEAALMPFLVIGDPSMNTSDELAMALVRGGADLLEFGLAFSDPPADGPVIQAAGKRALTAGADTESAFAFLTRLRVKTEAPIALLLYYNLVLARGVDAFYRRAKAAGVDAILVADLPVEESEEMVRAADAHGIAPIFIVSERTSAARLEQVADKGRGYLYLVARAGVTGERTNVQTGLDAVISAVRKKTSLPLLAGFGLSTPDHVRAVLEAGADGAITGSALVKRIEENLGDEAKMIASVESFVRSMKEATKRRRSS
jgi:tryptophan synthase alpha chain